MHLDCENMHLACSVMHLSCQHMRLVYEKACSARHDCQKVLTSFALCLLRHSVGKNPVQIQPCDTIKKVSRCVSVSIAPSQGA